MNNATEASDKDPHWDEFNTVVLSVVTLLFVTHIPSDTLI